MSVTVMVHVDSGRSVSVLPVSGRPCVAVTLGDDVDIFVRSSDDARRVAAAFEEAAKYLATFRVPVERAT